MSTGERNPSYAQAHAFLTENLAELVQNQGIEILAEWLSGFRDGYAEAKAHRQLMELATRCENDLRKERERQRVENDEMRDFYRNHGEAA